MSRKKGYFFKKRHWIFPQSYIAVIIQIESYDGALQGIIIFKAFRNLPLGT